MSSQSVGQRNNAPIIWPQISHSLGSEKFADNQLETHFHLRVVTAQFLIESELYSARSSRSVTRLLQQSREQCYEKTTPLTVRTGSEQPVRHFKMYISMSARALRQKMKFIQRDGNERDFRNGLVGSSVYYS